MFDVSCGVLLHSSHLGNLSIPCALRVLAFSNVRCLPRCASCAQLVLRATSVLRDRRCCCLQCAEIFCSRALFGWERRVTSGRAAPLQLCLSASPTAAAHSSRMLPDPAITLTTLRFRPLVVQGDTLRALHAWHVHVARVFQGPTRHMHVSHVCITCVYHMHVRLGVPSCALSKHRSCASLVCSMLYPLGAVPL